MDLLHEVFKHSTLLMGWTAAIGAGLGALGGLFPKKTTTTSSSNTNTSQQQNSNFNSGGFTAPTFDPAADELRKNLISKTLGGLNDDPNLSGYEASGLHQINQSNEANQMALRQSLAARGLSYSGGPAATQNDQANFAAKSNFVNSLPLLKQQLMQQKMQQALDVFKANPYGTTFGQSGSSSMTGSGTSSTNGTSTQSSGGGLGGFLGGLAGAFGSGSFDPSNFGSGGSPLPGWMIRTPGGN